MPVYGDRRVGSGFVREIKGKNVVEEFFVRGLRVVGECKEKVPCALTEARKVSFALSFGDHSRDHMQTFP